MLSEYTVPMITNPTVIRLDPEDVKTLRKVAKETDRSLSGVVRMAVREFIARYKRRTKRK